MTKLYTAVHDNLSIATVLQSVKLCIPATLSCMESAFVHTQATNEIGGLSMLPLADTVALAGLLIQYSNQVLSVAEHHKRLCTYFDSYQN